MQTTDTTSETSITEIAILPDGRIYVFGLSWQVLDLLADAGLGDAALKQRAETLRRLAAAETRGPTGRTVPPISGPDADSVRVTCDSTGA